MTSDAPDAAALPLPSEPPLPSLVERARQVLTAPQRAFAQHDGRWGWAGPWGIAAAISLLLAVAVFARVDLDARVKTRWDRMSASPGASGLKALTDDQRDQAARAVAFFEKAKWVAAPLATLVSIVVWGLLAFGICHLMSPKRPDLLRCLSVSAYASLAGVVGDAAQLLAVLAGRAPAGTSPAVLVDEIGSPALHTALTRLDPALLFGYALLAVGLWSSCGLERRRAYGVCAGLWVVLSLVLVAAAGLGGRS